MQKPTTFWSTKISDEWPMVLVLNGPKQTGKTAVMSRLMSLDKGIAFAGYNEAHIVALTAIGYNYDWAKVDWDDQAFKSQSFSDASVFVTNRNAIISLDEWGRETFGPDFWSKRFYSRLCAHLQNYDSVVTSIRMEEDICAWPQSFRQHCALLRLWRDGHDWEGDNGNYLYPEGFQISLDIDANKPVEVLVRDILALFGCAGVLGDYSNDGAAGFLADDLGVPV